MTTSRETSKRRDRPGIILVADDDVGICRALQLLLDLNGLVAEMVHTPFAAIQRVRGGDVRIVIHDMNFSRGDTSGNVGLALFRDLRREAPEVAVILVTAWPTADVRASVLHEGAVAYLPKPWDDEGLVTLIRQLLAGDGLAT